MIDRFEVFTTTITQLYKSLQRIKSHEMTEFDLKGTHVMCIFELNRHPDGLTVTQLSSICEEDKAAISRTISDLTERGLITTLGDKKYRAPIVLTDAGKEVAKKIDALVVKAVEAGNADMTHEDRVSFYRTLKNISENLKQYLDTLDQDK